MTIGPQLSRRGALGMFAGAAVAGALGSPCGAESDSEAGSPSSVPASVDGSNVLLIMVDDLNEYLGYMGGYGGTIVTPNLDALAAESMAFTSFHVAVPICAPSRATMLWGLSPTVHGLTSCGSPGTPEYAAFSRENAKSHIIQLIADHGYRTCGGGKIFHGGLGTRHHPAAWSEGYLETEHLVPNGDWGPYGTGSDFGELPEGEVHPDEELTDWCIEKMGQMGAGAPFLMAAGIRLPHLGWFTPARFIDMYPLDELVLPEVRTDDWNDLGPIGRSILEQDSGLYDAGWYEVVEDSGTRDLHLQHYLAAISHSDEMIGRLLNELASQPYADDTVVVVASDNGYDQGEHMAMRKLTLNNESTRVPLLIRAPGGMGFDPGQITTPVGSIDFAATMLDITGAERPESVEGSSLRDFDPARSRAHVVSYAYDAVSVVSDTDRWTLHHDGSGELAEVEHYEQGADPGEYTNLMASWQPGDPTSEIPPEVLAQV